LDVNDETFIAALTTQEDGSGWFVISCDSLAKEKKVIPVNN